MKICRSLCLFFCSTCLGACDLVPLWDYLGRGKVEQRKFYLEKVRFESLREIDLLKEDPKLTVGVAAQTAYSALRKLRNDNVVVFKVESVSLLFQSIKGKRLYYYEVRFEDESAEFTAVIFVTLDGKVVPSMTLSEWKDFRAREPKD